MVVETELPGGESFRYVGNPIKLAGAPSAIDRLPPPRLGEHTDLVLGEIGVEESALAELRAQGAIG